MQSRRHKSRSSKNRTRSVSHKHHTKTMTKLRPASAPQPNISRLYEISSIKSNRNAQDSQNKNSSIKNNVSRSKSKSHSQNKSHHSRSHSKSHSNASNNSQEKTDSEIEREIEMEIAMEIEREEKAQREEKERLELERELNRASAAKYPTMEEVNDASIMYANALNGNPLTPVVQALLDSSEHNHVSGRTRKGFVAAPYIFINRDGFDYEDKDSDYDLVASLYLDTEEDKYYNLENDFEALGGPIAESVYQVFLNQGFGKKHTQFAGIMGIKVHSADGSEFGDHYISYVYDNGHFAFFDSGSPAPCVEQSKTNGPYIILLKVMDKIAALKKPKQKNTSSRIQTRSQLLTVSGLTTECNVNTFETAAGASNDSYNYIGQNIFCHSWSMWFIYQYVVLKKSMSEIDSFAGVGIDADKNNLLRIKAFVYKTIIPKAGLSQLFNDPEFDAFRYYIYDPEFRSGEDEDDDNEANNSQLNRERNLRRRVRVIPELEL